MLRSLRLLPVYDSADHDLVRELQVPLLQHSSRYLRGVGFFTSGWMRLAAVGLSDFVSNGGKARLVISPILEPGDWKALQYGEQARANEALKDLLVQRIRELSISLEQDTLNALAWMVAEGFLELRFAVARKEPDIRLYHDKIGLYRDNNGDAVAIHGSLNDSVHGSLNGEAFSVFASWEPGQAAYVNSHTKRLEALWNDENTQFKCHTIPEAVKQEFVSLRKKDVYQVAVHSGTTERSEPYCPYELHPFQKEAIAAWEVAKCCGIFEMATGTGKTITALAAAVHAYKRLGRLALIILVPYLHLLDQWAENCRIFGFQPILCSGSHQGWQMNLQMRLQDYRINACKSLCVLAVHDTAASHRFQDIIAKTPPKTSMLVGDEVHCLGARHHRRALSDAPQLRLGLSATPRRWYDENGTDAIFCYFGNTCFEFTINQAIGSFLTPYVYYPKPVSLSDEELKEYEGLTARITHLAEATETDAVAAERLKKLLLARSRLVGGAEAKLPALLADLQNQIEKDKARKQESHGILVYCAPGKHRQVLKAVASLGLRCHEFVHTVTNNERQVLLKQFETGQIQVLVAVRCLDEGVDVPSTQSAYILASSTNPREFVQRRGRILRQAKGKHQATVCDYLVVPSLGSSTTHSVDVGLLKREMPRFAEFASAAVNEFEARAVLRPIVDAYQQLPLLELKPWDVYRELRKERVLLDF